jgi:hypothetical protein
MTKTAWWHVQKRTSIYFYKEREEDTTMLKTGVKIGLFFLLFLGAIQLVLTELERYLPEEDAITVTSLKSEEEILPELEMFLVGREEADGYVVETYREYELVRNSNGEVIEKTATENYEYIRYKQ